MKKIYYLMICALVGLFTITGCSSDDEDTSMDFVLSNSMVNVTGLSSDYLVQVDNTNKTVYIELAYADKDEASALNVQFSGLPTGVTADPATSTFNYSNGNTQSVIFSQGKNSVTYVISVGITDPDPQITSMTLNDIAVESGTAKLKSSDNLSKVVVVFTVSPDNSVVTVGDEVVNSGDTLDFSDKINGVTFTITCEDVENEYNVKVVTTGINSVERVWGHYYKPSSITDTWFGDKVTGEQNVIRTMSMDDKYVYLAATNKTIYAVDITNSDNVQTLSMDGYSAGGVFSTSAIQTIKNGDSYVTLVSNMVNSTQSEFVIWKWDSVDSAPEKVLSYHLPETGRIGDEMTVEGDWNDGKIWLHDYTSGKKAYVFSITNGSINATPTIITYDTKMGNWGAMYKYEDNTYVWGGPAKSRIFTVSGTTATSELEFDSANFGYPLHGISFFTFNEQAYMSYVVLRNSWKDADLRLTELNAATLAESIENPGATLRFGLGDPTEYDVTAIPNGNGMGNSVLRVINDEIYIAAFVPGAGVSLFKVE